MMSTASSYGTIIFVLAVMAVLEALICRGATVAIPEIFPTKVRCSAIGVGYNITVAAFGGTAPFIVTWLTKVTGNVLALTYYLIPGMIITLCTVLFLYQETYGKELE